MHRRCCCPPDSRSAERSRSPATSSYSPARRSASSRRVLELGRAPAPASARRALLGERVGDVVVDAHRERVGLLEDHRHAPAQVVDLELVDLLAVERDASRRAPAPAVTSVRRFSERSSVVLPEPDAPISASTSPWRTGKRHVAHDPVLAVGQPHRLDPHALARPHCGSGRAMRWRTAPAVAAGGGAVAGGLGRDHAGIALDDDPAHGRRHQGVHQRASAGQLVSPRAELRQQDRQRAAFVAAAAESRDEHVQRRARSSGARTPPRRPSAASCPRRRASCSRRSWSASSRCRAAAPSSGALPTAWFVSVAPSRIVMIAVSPMIRPMPSTTPLAMSGRIAGSSTERIVRRARLAQRVGGLAHAIGDLRERLARGADDQRQREQRHDDARGEERSPVHRAVGRVLGEEAEKALREDEQTEDRQHDAGHAGDHVDRPIRPRERAAPGARTRQPGRQRHAERRGDHDADRGDDQRAHRSGRGSRPTCSAAATPPGDSTNSAGLR